MPTVTFVVFHMSFAIVTVALIAGSIAGRAKMGGWIAFVVAWTLLVYIPMAHWAFDPAGWVAKQLGAVDFSGGTVVEIGSGAAGLALAIVAGKRADFERQDIRPHNLPLVVIGLSLMWFGWFGFNTGSSLGTPGGAAMAFLNSQLAAGAAMAGWAVTSWWRTRRLEKEQAYSEVLYDNLKELTADDRRARGKGEEPESASALVARLREVLLTAPTPDGGSGRQAAASGGERQGGAGHGTGNGGDLGRARSRRSVRSRPPVPPLLPSGHLVRVAAGAAQADAAQGAHQAVDIALAHDVDGSVHGEAVQLGPVHRPPRPEHHAARRIQGAHPVEDLERGRVAGETTGQGQHGDVGEQDPGVRERYGGIVGVRDHLEVRVALDPRPQALQLPALRHPDHQDGHHSSPSSATSASRTSRAGIGVPPGPDRDGRSTLM